ncbi:MAG: hypothetical protein K6F63_05220 [Lachnospiraceae bacterium]|nr:hypothetical protein [Lachnospiraceae bacterium]
MLFSFDEKGKGITVKADDLYDGKKGYGFITEKNPPVSGLGNHFVFPAYYGNEEAVKPEQCEKGIFVDNEAALKKLEAPNGGLIPLCFAADVPEYGNYRVTVKLSATGEAVVFAGSRRLYFRDRMMVETSVIVVFDLNVSRIIPRGSTEAADRRTVFVTALGEDAVISSIEIEKSDAKTVFICGDSTVTDQPADYPYYPGSSYSGWGQMLSDHVHGMAISNHAHSGLTTESFRSEGHYAIVREMLSAGDYVMFQFAHNDQKLAHLKAKEGYRNNLLRYIEETRKGGAFPIIVSPLARNTWKPDNGGYNDLLKEYADECISIGKEFDVPVIDLHDFSMKEVLRDGLESSKRFYFPKDYTHTNDFGAYKMALFISKELEKLTGDYAPIAEAAHYDEMVWDVNEIPKVPEIPERFRETKTETADNEKAAEVERPEDELLRAEALDMVIKAAKFFPTNVFNDIYDDIVGHEWYAGTVQCAFQNGIIPKEMTADKKFCPEEPVTLEDFMCFTVAACGSRKKLPEGKATVYDGVCKTYARESMRIAVALGLIGEDRNPKDKMKRKEGAAICARLGL